MSATKHVEPVVGRHVWFGHTHNQAVPFSATICGINADGTVNLGVYDFEGNSHSYVGVRLIQEGEPTPTQGPFCKWPIQERPATPQGSGVGPSEFAGLVARVAALESFITTPTAAELPSVKTEQPEKTPEKPGKKG